LGPRHQIGGRYCDAINFLIEKHISAKLGSGEKQQHQNGQGEGEFDHDIAAIARSVGSTPIVSRA
jgi:hypothetical protein